MRIFTMLIQTSQTDSKELGKNWKSANPISSSPPTIACQFSNLESLKHSAISLGSTSSSTGTSSEAEMSRSHELVTPTPTSPLSPAPCPSSDHAVTPTAALGASGDGYVAPSAEKPYTLFVDPRLDLTANVVTAAAAGEGADHAHNPTSGTPFTRQAAPPQHAEVKAVLQSSNAKRIKTLLRNSHWSSTNPIRESLWKDICLSLRQVYSSIYMDVKRNTLGADPNQYNVKLPKFVDVNTKQSYMLNAQGETTTKNVLCVISATCPDITFSPIIYSFTSLLLHYQNEEDCYNCIYGILRQKTGGLPQTSIAFDATRYILRDLSKKYAKALYKYAAQKGLQLENIFNQWIFWIFKDLPFDYMIRVVDCFLYEGPKVLYRVAIGILILFYKHVGPNAMGTSGTDIAKSIRNFCETIPYTIEELFKVAFGLRGFSRAILAKMAARSESFLIAIRRANSIVPTPIAGLYSGGGGAGGGMASSAAALASAMTSTGAGKQHQHRDHIGVQELSDVGSSLLTPEQCRRRSRSLCSGLAPIIDIPGKIIASHEWQLLWGWLPTRMTLLQPELVYTTLEHGTSLKTFFGKVDDLEPTLMLIKTTDGDIFGSYCSTDWAVRKSLSKDLSYFGTGETFVFTLSPQRRRYAWIGVEQGERTAASAHMFMAASKQTLLIGGGGGVAIQLDEDLYKGRTETCDTFKNPVLAKQTDFKCSTIEVYSFQ